MVSKETCCYIFTMTVTHVILDGLAEPALGRELSARWVRAGFRNTVDIAGQCGTLSRMTGDVPLTENEVDGAAAIARVVGIELRERAGETFRPDNDLAALRGRMAYEYKSRFATALVFGLPALALHYLSPTLAGGAPTPRDMLYPWLFELLLVGWTCLAAGWPILWQGVVSMRYLRPTPDLFTTVIILLAFVPSAIAVISLGFSPQPWLIPAPLFHIAAYAIILAVFQRWLLHRAAGRLSGRANLMPPGFGRVLIFFILVAMLLAWRASWSAGLAVALLLSPMLPLGAINRWSPGASMLLPVFGFVVFFLIGPRALQWSMHGMEVEIAASFQLLMVAVFAGGWTAFKKAAH